MGFGGISIWQLGIILVIVLLLFGTKKLRGMGGDLGGAIKGFKKAMSEDGGKGGDAASDTEGSASAEGSAKVEDMKEAQEEEKAHTAEEVKSK